MIKWFLAVLGYFVFRLPGAVIGFLLGSVFENVSKSSSGSFETVFRNTSQRPVSPADFELNLLSLCSIVIKADGSVNQTELNYVRQYFVSTYGKDKANAIFKTFNEVVKQREISAQRICAYLAGRTRYEMRLQILHFLFGIANADGAVTSGESSKIKEIAGYFRIHFRDFESIQAMFVKKGDDAYKILEIDKTATPEEIKKAYRKMVKKYHPDKVITQDEAIKKGAEEKFKQVQRAYEQLQKERGF
ncbi:TerB family tellurite resistance protein [Abyssalbus ytuae]|uniref:TerB family tellurite resistance protein n=1 Tax=Abyssalbus ytuae TaxID=2926907 RepID=A0A9E7CTE1_9FLAO|nr:TerB family tellurite resistance protein [Abyssalbus ytuae]UOB16002.1 TerB family tellurite resistance protein [Abyssalbus ytuae]